MFTYGFPCKRFLENLDKPSNHAPSVNSVYKVYLSFVYNFSFVYAAFADERYVDLFLQISKPSLT